MKAKKIPTFLTLVIAGAAILFSLSDLWAQTKKQDRGVQVKSTVPVTQGWGNNYALIVGVNAYREWTPLQTATNDARVLSDILIKQYGYSNDRIILRTDDKAALSQLTADLHDAAGRLRSDDNLPIYFAGHGQIDDLTREGYWIPVEGKLKDPSTWLPPSMVKNILSSDLVKGKNIVGVADSCYAGVLLRGGVSLLSVAGARYQDRLRNLSGKKSRQVIPSGGNEPVTDGGRDGHSLFAYYFLQALRENDRAVIDLENLFHARVWKYVTEIGGQRPNAGRLKTPMDEGSQFVLAPAAGVTAEAGPDDSALADERKRIAEKEKKLEEERARVAALREQLDKEKKLEEERMGLEAERLRLEEEKRKREEEAKRIAMARRPPKDFTNPLGMEFVLIPAGRFTMGSPTSESGRFDWEGPQHEVEITKPFYMGKYEVQVGEFRAFVKDTGYKTEAETGDGAFTWTGNKWEKKAETYWDNPGFSQTDSHPVTCISWNDAMEFIKWVSKKTGHTYRLPTEAEREYTCRAGTKTARHWGDSPNEACRYGNVADQTAKQQFPGWRVHECEDGYVNTAPVGRFQPNAFGLYDMLGNVWEWCQDWYGGYSSGFSTDPSSPGGGSPRVIRGGSWNNEPRNVRCATRNYHSPSYRSDGLGLRLVRTIE
jgi:formylglycine-generating enzyme required for sulfatase activity